MKSYKSILKDIETLKKLITRTASDARSRIFEEVRTIALINKDITESDKIRLEKAREAERAENERNNDLKIKIEILKDNARNAFFCENIGKICDIWNSYEGKTHGEKTRQKILQELRNATNEIVQIYNNYDKAEIKIFSRGFIDGLTFFSISTENGMQKAIDPQNNKILKIDPEQFKICFCSEYVPNIESHLKALKKLQQEAEQMQTALNEKIKKYNALARGNIKHFATCDSVKELKTI